jgi:ATP-dependent Clp protease ATP-binding subunit ClpC
MLERFTARSRRVVVLAIEEARGRRHEAVGPEHLLVGILRDGDGMAVKVLERLQVPLETVRGDLERLLNDGPGSATACEPTFSSELRAVFQAAVESRFQPQHVIGTENLLLGLLVCEAFEATQVLRAAGVDLDQVRRVTSLFYDSMAIPITTENIRFIATSKWRREI